MKNKLLVLALFSVAFVSSGYSQSISDKEIKINVIEMSNALEKINQLEPVTYQYDTHKYKQLHFSNGKKFGFLAENLQKIFPEMVYSKHISYMAGKNMYKSYIVKQVDKESLIPVLVASIKELHTEIEKLKLELLELRNK